MDKVVFLDRDGTINEEVHYLYRPEDFKFLPGVPEALKMLTDAGYKLVVVTNQAGVARGYYSEEDVVKLHAHVNELLKPYGTGIDGFYYCPHHPEYGIGRYKADCKCRKPGIGLFEQAEKDFAVDKSASYMIGDKLLDVTAGKRYGVTSILVGTGYGARHRRQAEEEGLTREYDWYADTLKQAVRWILRREKEEIPMSEMDYLEQLTRRYPVLAPVRDSILAAYEAMKESFENGGKLLVAGNGGSCADSEHIVGELMKGFVKRRPVTEEFAKALAEADPQRGPELAAKLQGGLAAIALTGHNGLSTAYANDVDGGMVFAQQLYGYGRKGDVFLGISTSGNSANVMYAMAAAKAMGIKTIALTGRDGGAMGRSADVAVIVPETETYMIQELHLPVYHALCLMLEEHFF